MSATIQIRNVPDDLHRELKSRAALAGMSLSDYLLAEARRVVARPSTAVLRARVRGREPVELSEDPVAVMRAERDTP